MSGGTLRIFPLYYGVLALVFGAGALIPALGTPSFRELAGLQGWLWTYTTNWAHSLRPEAVFNCDWIELYHFWSLAVEEQFYLIWPTAVLLLPRRWFVGGCTAILIAAAASVGLEPGWAGSRGSSVRMA
jgi:peptidoglycan/LPS O-acetylase OafA/YrhL